MRKNNLTYSNHDTISNPFVNGNFGGVATINRSSYFSFNRNPCTRELPLKRPKDWFWYPIIPPAIYKLPEEG